VLFFFPLIETVFIQWLRLGWIRSVQQIYIKLPLYLIWWICMTYCSMHFKSTIWNSDVCVHVCMLCMYMCIISIILWKYVHIMIIWIKSLRQKESIIKCLLYSWNQNMILNHNVNNVQLIYFTYIYGLIMYMYSENNNCCIIFFSYGCINRWNVSPN
jgi:hypothetical protein